MVSELLILRITGERLEKRMNAKHHQRCCVIPKFPGLSGSRRTTIGEHKTILQNEKRP